MRGIGLRVTREQYMSDKKRVLSLEQALCKENILKLAVATLYHARIVKGAADAAFIKSDEFSRESLAEDAELRFIEPNDVWTALPLVEKCLRMEIPSILNEQQNKLDEQFRLGKISGLRVATEKVMDEASEVFMRGGKDSSAVALREAASHLQKMLDAWRVAMGLWNHEEEEDDER